MKAITVISPGSASKLETADLPPPHFGPEDVIVETAAAGINRADLMQRDGRYPPPPGASPLLGLEIAGTISEVGYKVDGWRVGDKVCALLPGGGYCSAVAVPHQMLMPVPEGWSFIEAAAFPEAYFTAFLNLIIEAGLRPGERLLVHGGASGVGTAAIQLARAWGCSVAATAGSDQKAGVCRKLGADPAINYRNQNFAEIIEKQFGAGSIAVILDPVGGSYFENNLKLLAPGGRLVILSLLGGSKAEINLGTLLRNRLRILGSTLRNRPLAEKIELRNQLLAALWPLIAADKIRPVIDSVFPAAAAEEAHNRMRSNLNCGKIVLTFDRG